jgi:hypothetical protein
LAEGQARPAFPWLYPYEEDGPRLGSIVLRPVVPVSIVGREAAPVVSALVDSGCEHVLAAPWAARAASVDPGSSSREVNLGLGGETVRVRFLDLTMRLHAPGVARDDVYVEWQTEVGFLSHWRPTGPVLLGQVGFLDQFTTTFSRMARHLAVEEVTVFDRRFGVPLAR